MTKFYHFISFSSKFTKTFLLPSIFTEKNKSIAIPDLKFGWWYIYTSTELFYINISTELLYIYLHRMILSMLWEASHFVLKIWNILKVLRLCSALISQIVLKMVILLFCRSKCHKLTFLKILSLELVNFLVLNVIWWFLLYAVATRYTLQRK